MVRWRTNTEWYRPGPGAFWSAGTVSAGGLDAPAAGDHWQAGP